MAAAALQEADFRAAMSEILKSNELSQLTSRIVRSKLEEKFGVDLRERKKELDNLLLEVIEEQQAGPDGKDGGDDQENGSNNESKLERESDSSGEEKEEEDVNDEELARKLQNDERSLRKRQSVKKSQERKAPKAKRSGGEKKGERKGTGFGKPMVLSEQLAAVVGESRMSRSDVVKRMWAIIKERKLEDPKNKRYTICDEELALLFGRKKIQTFGMMKYLKKHIKDPSLIV